MEPERGTIRATMWRSRFETGYGLDVRHTTDRMMCDN